ncbi:MAG: endolytic transglycosylase MltG [Nitrospiria bacterium]
MPRLNKKPAPVIVRHRHVLGLVFMLGAMAFGIHVATFLAAPPGSSHTVRTFDIADDEPMGQVAMRLERAGLIRNRVYFMLFGRLTGSERALKPGEYALSAAMRPLDILGRFRRGTVILHPVTIPEGSTARQIASRLSAAGLAEADEFLRLVNSLEFIGSLGLDLSSLEGYLFPDTYHFARRTPVEAIARRMVDRFRSEFPPQWDARGAKLGLSRHQVVTLASIIEKETAASFERPLISAVFHTRLRKRMPLQSDPTVIYPILKFDGNLRKVDLIRDSPYNTYRRRGLPPGPIANPGRAALEAALYPAPVDYLFFVSKNDGTHQFSRSLREHNAAVDRYQRRGLRRAAPKRAVVSRVAG